jgi:hypothetical protein
MRVATDSAMSSFSAEKSKILGVVAGYVRQKVLENSVSPTAANSAGFSLSRTEPVLLECSARLPSLYSRAQSDDLASSA